MQFLHSIFEIGKSTWEATQKWVGYINCLDTNMKNLKRKTKYLSSQENDINKEVNIAEQWSRKGRKKEVEVWQKDVQRIKGDVQALQIQEQEIVGWKNVFSRVRLGKLVVDKIKEVAEVQEKGRFSNDLLIDAFPNCAQFIPTTGSLGEITSARNMEKVWEYLMDDEVRRTSIYGMGGFAKQPSCITSTIDS
ncbi:Disease resistance protein RFL1 [Camellia lanceoleosa]|uniref:Disease resistance protein RFL1 n=1 Tax=Camellia lanceoleosa TaxID=1840588 RepID=A0ACC0FK54_9ERIC|nr:Disease resistance protein RFL1 [Camellia lanceoleosa]